jgi:hypothetical protein
MEAIKVKYKIVKPKTLFSQTIEQAIACVVLRSCFLAPKVTPRGFQGDTLGFQC